MADAPEVRAPQLSQVSTKDYLTLVAMKLDEAEGKMDVEECIRLAGVCIDAIHEYIQKCEKFR